MAVAKMAVPALWSMSSHDVDVMVIISANIVKIVSFSLNLTTKCLFNLLYKSETAY